MIGTESTEIPTVTITIKIPGGHILQAADTAKIGLADMFADMMNEDTKNYTAEQMAVALQKLGSNVSIGSSFDGITFTIQTLKKNLDKTLELVQERMFNPKFTDAAFTRIQKANLENFKQAKADPASVADAVFAKVNYGPNSILAMSEGGTEYTIKNMKIADVENYYKNYMTSQGVKVVVVGDVKEAEVLPKLAFLNKLPYKKIDLPKVNATASVVDKTKVYMVDVPKAAQSQFRVGYATGLKYDATPVIKLRVKLWDKGR